MVVGTLWQRWEWRDCVVTCKSWGTNFLTESFTNFDNMFKWYGSVQGTTCFDVLHPFLRQPRQGGPRAAHQSCLEVIGSDLGAQLSQQCNAQLQQRLPWHATCCSLALSSGPRSRLQREDTNCT